MASEIEEILAAYRRSGLTQRVFAQEAGIGVSTLQLWLRQTRAPGAIRSVNRKSSAGANPPAISLLEVELAGTGAGGGGVRTPYYEIEFRGGECLRLPSGFGENDARRLLALLREDH
jgi:hypothetical protein